MSDAYGAELEAMAHLTEADVAAAIPLLHPGTIVELAKGPTANRYGCRVCIALADATRAPQDRNDPTNPRWVVFAYHELAKIGMTHRDQLHYGPLANETYERCLTIYRLAGWTGEAQEPNA